jgi:hypothetical protein
MFVLVSLLFFAFLPTVNYRWQLGRSAEDTGPPTPEDYAICYLKPMSRLDYHAHSMYWEGLNYHSHSEHTIVATSTSYCYLSDLCVGSSNFIRASRSFLITAFDGESVVLFVYRFVSFATGVMFRAPLEA